MSRITKIGEPEVIGTGRDLGIRWILSKRVMVSQDETIPGLFLETDDGHGGGGSGGFDVSRSLEASLSSLEPGLVGIYGPLTKSPHALAVEVELADGSTRPGHVVRSPEPYDVDFFVAVVDRRPVRLTVTTERGGQWTSIDGHGFRYTVPE